MGRYATALFIEEMGKFGRRWCELCLETRKECIRCGFRE
jgi:hypothetical protein